MLILNTGAKSRGVLLFLHNTTGDPGSGIPGRVGHVIVRLLLDYERHARALRGQKAVLL